MRHDSAITCSIITSFMATFMADSNSSSGPLSMGIPSRGSDMVYILILINIFCPSYSSICICPTFTTNTFISIISISIPNTYISKSLSFTSVKTFSFISLSSKSANFSHSKCLSVQLLICSHLSSS